MLGGEAEKAALITGAIVLFSVSVVVAIYFWKRRIKRNTSKEREENLELTEKLVKTYKNHHVPKNIRDQLQGRIADWEKKDKMFVSTRASQYVIKCLQNNSCLTVTGPSGVGKTFISRHVALLFQKKGYKIIPVYSPIDIRDYYQPGKQTVFIVDDICGNFTANQQQIENWKQLLPVINTIIADKCCKIIVSCRLQVYKDDKFNILSPFKSCECNLVSDDLCLTSNEKKNIAKIYTATSMQYIDDVSFNREFFPLLCSLYHKNRNVDIKEFFKSPFGFYRSELDTLSEHGDEGNYKICGLALCVLFNNQLEEKWFEGKMTDAQRQIIEDTCDACEINRSTSKSKLKKELDTLDGTFIFRQNRIYRTVHDKVFDFLAHYFGQKMIECLIEHGDSDLVHERFIWQKSTNDKKCNIDFVIEIPDDHLESYLQRLTEDWSEGKVTVVFNNTNLKVSSFRQKLLEKLEQLKKPKKVSLVNTKDTVIPKTDCGSGNTPLILTCYYGYTDMVQWVLRNNVNVDQCRDDRVSGLDMASQEGHTDIVNLLLERKPEVNLCNKDGVSPLLRASQNGHTDIVRLLLERNPDVNLCDIDGCSPLLLASQNGHTDIVKLLLERKPDVNLCNKNGSSPLLQASQEGHTVIVKFLLERNPDVNLCDKDGLSPLLQASQNGHTDIVKLLLERDPDVNLCNNNTYSPLIWASYAGHTDIVRLLLETNPDQYNNTPLSTLHVTSISSSPSLVQPLKKHRPNINAQTYDGGNALYFSALNGHIEITQLLLKNNADSNICIHSKQYITGTLNNHPSITLEIEKQNVFDSLIMGTPSGVTEYVRNKSVDYAFAVIAGSSPLHIACFIGRINVVRCLLDHNANINMTKDDGITPLWYACELGHQDIVRLLLDKKADTKIYKNDGKSPLEIATDNGHTSIVEIVKKYMKKETHI
ncbi:ankyrin-3-like [Mytilus edulis]|uniref:ankyrin-3-like n=1 Tax=Mytilus edulis TaxID=6550 RepID=UPI0039EF5D8E